MASTLRVCRLCGTALLPVRAASRPTSAALSKIRHLSTSRLPSSSLRTATAANPLPQPAAPKTSALYLWSTRWRSMATIVSRPAAGSSNDLPPELMDLDSPSSSQQENQEGIDLSPTSDAEGDRSVILTEAASNQIRKIQEKEGNPKVLLRLGVESGGCHGYQYKIELTEKVNEDDYTFAADPTSSFPQADPSHPLLVIDSTSLSLVSGATVDYATELIGSSFRVPFNPNAKGAGCGCGVSWELAD